MIVRRLHAGFTLIELLITVSIAVLLIVLALPGYGVWLADTQIRGAAQSIASGLRYAQGEAVKRNEQVQLVLDSTTKTGGWVVQLVSDGSTLQSGFFVEGADRVQFTTTPKGNTTVIFTAIGQVAAANVDLNIPEPFDTVDVALSVTDSRPLRVLVGGGRTGIKICDPAWAPPDPKGCPAP